MNQEIVILLLSNRVLKLIFPLSEKKLRNDKTPNRVTEKKKCFSDVESKTHKGGNIWVRSKIVIAVDASINTLLFPFIFLEIYFCSNNMQKYIFVIRKKNVLL